ncbi:MAG: hypothetical protein K8R59_15855 [Thermoanaerobaculales bacterium]|nr:hypothetical protein [Thermoanaerobaculales bacterium]
MKIRSVVLLALIVVIAGCCGPENDCADTSSNEVAELRGPYFGQAVPGSEPQLFAPDFVSSGLDTRDVAMTPDGKEFYFVAFVGGKAVIMVSALEDDLWSEAVVAPFSGRFLDAEPCISPDGGRFFFLSTRPLPGQEAKEGWVYQDIWVMDRLEEGWGEPYNLGAPVNSDAPEYFPSVTSDGTMYFTREGENRVSAIFRSRLVDGGYSEIERLPDQVNLGTNRFNAFVAPDETFVIVPAIGGPDSLGGVDYYVVFRNDDDSWSEPVNLGEKINQPTGQEWSASLSPDGKYLFFMSSRTTGDEIDSLTGKPLSELLNIASHAGKGSSGIWWVDAQVIYDLRPPIPPPSPRP